MSAQQVQFFHDEGYLIVTDVFAGDELQPLRRELEQRVAGKAEELHSTGKLADTFAGESFDHRLAKIYRDNTDAGQAIVRDLHGIAGGGHCGIEMFKLISHPKLLAVVEAIVGEEIVASSVYRLRPKIPGFTGGVVPWHQDSGYFTQQCDNQLILTVWVPLVDADRHNGCMKILPRAHRRGVCVHHTGGNANFLVIEDKDLPLDPAEAITAECPLGGVVLMTNRTPHCSTENHSDIVRWSVDLRYQSAQVPNNLDDWPDLENDPPAEVLMACYPPEADFVVRSRAHPERVATYEQYVQRRTHYDRIKQKSYPRRGWTPLTAGA